VQLAAAGVLTRPGWGLFQELLLALGILAALCRAHPGLGLPGLPGRGRVAPSPLLSPGSSALTPGRCLCSCPRAAGPWATGTTVTPLDWCWVCSGRGVGAATWPLPMPRAQGWGLQGLILTFFLLPCRL